MDIDKIESVVEKANLSSKAANYVISVLIMVVSVMGLFVYKLATKPAPEIKESNALQFLNNNDVSQNENILQMRNEINELRVKLDNCKCK